MNTLEKTSGKSIKMRGRSIIYLHTEREANLSLFRFMKKQVLGGLSLVAGVVLSIPGVPGPGFLFFSLALLLLDYPAKSRLFLYLKGKRPFRIVRVMLWKKWSIFLLLPKTDQRG
ncbi:MAG: hypothetical protein HQL67_01705 [Magnetococcales bacterium]|nr:hypothetical protein [Magnetococcales bacterium]